MTRFFASSEVVRSSTILILLLLYFFHAGKARAQEIPPTVRVVPRDTLIYLKKPSLVERIADRYSRDTLIPNRKGFAFRPGATIGIGYRIRTTKHNEQPFGSEHSLSANYGINRGAFFLEYKGIVHQLIGQWDLVVNARADIINVMNFYGVGNESERLHDDEYYEIKSAEWLGAVGMVRDVNMNHSIELKSFFQSVRIRAEEDHYFSDINGFIGEEFVRNNYLGLHAGYRFLQINNPVRPSTGWDVGIQSSYTINLDDDVEGFARFTSYITKYFPLSAKFTWAARIGGATLFGDPRFYQLNILGGRENLRGFRRQRFYGKTSLFMNNELRWITSTNKKLMKSIGLLGFTDAGRMWLPGETSDKIHIGYGGGLIIIPFDRIVLNGSLGYSEEGRVIHFRVGFLF